MKGVGLERKGRRTATSSGQNFFGFGEERVGGPGHLDLAQLLEQGSFELESHATNGPRSLLRVTLDPFLRDFRKDRSGTSFVNGLRWTSTPAQEALVA